MANLLMITGDRALASGRKGAFFNTLEELHKHFDRIDVICPYVSVRRYDMTILGNVFVHPSPWPAFFQWFWIRFKGARIIHKHAVNMMTVHEAPLLFNGIGAAWLSRATGIPYMLEVHHVVGYPRPASLRERIGRALTRWVLPRTTRRAAVLRTVNEHEVPDWLVSIGIPRAKIAVVPSVYIDLDVFKPQDIPKQYDVIFVGRRSPNKGFKLFQRIVRLAGLKALVIGEGHRFVKDASEVAHAMNQSRLLLMTSYNEGGPRVVIEAMACGVPIVATPVGIVPDVLPPECIEEWNTAALADKVKNILGDADLYARLREQGIAISQRFERKATVATYAEAIKGIMINDK